MPIDLPVPCPDPNQRRGNLLEELEAERLARLFAADPLAKAEYELELRTIRSPIHFRPTLTLYDHRAQVVSKLDERYGRGWLARLCELDLDALLGPPLDSSSPPAKS